MKRFFQFMDHSCIYVLIAGTYTPFLLVYMRGPWGWSLFASLWILTFLGFIFKIFFIGKWNRLATFIYILMGWIAIVAIKPAIEMIPMGALWLMHRWNIFLFVGATPFPSCYLASICYGWKPYTLYLYLPLHPCPQRLLNMNDII